MSLRSRSLWLQRAGFVCVVAIAMFSMPQVCAGQLLGGGSAVGGVQIDSDGVLRNATVQETKVLRENREALLKSLPDDLAHGGIRRISLNRLQAAIRERVEAGASPVVTEEMELLGGMTRIQYVFAVPEENDIVLVGPAERPTIDAQGNVVGAKTGTPILRLDHFLVALRTAEATARQPITCSIDPTKEGLQRFAQYMRQVRGNHPNLITDVEAALGPQKLTIQGVPLDSELARTMFAADYRMKRIAMGHEPSNVRGIKSYVDMMTSANAATPRWWLAPKYDAIVRDADGLSWELRGPGVQVLTEDSVITASGETKRQGRANPLAQRFADQMTTNYEELSKKHPVFGELRNVIDMAIIAAVITKSNMLTTAGCDLSILLDAQALPTIDYDAVPQFVETKASVLAKRGRTFVTASGGVEINSWKILDEKQTDGKLKLVTGDVAPMGDHWWWD
ncbi:MAG: DUF1598 domain-containing protein [Pirellulales bacterium]|nr:DUF1598 domain-containing protein [Pirellulales bacterium]